MLKQTSKRFLSQTHPHLVAEWHPTRNSPLTHSTITCGIRIKLWWKCAKGHEWQSCLTHRTKKKPGNYH